MKVAVLTKNEHLFKLVGETFADYQAHCLCFQEDLALVRELPRQTFDLILIDANPRHFDSCHPISSWRACYSDRRTPIIVIGTFFNLETFKDTLAAGADDVVFGPIDSHELRARAYRLLTQKQTELQRDTRIEIQGYLLDKLRSTVFYHQQPIRLTSREFAIAWLFFSHPRHFFSRQQLSEAIWGNNERIVGRTLEQHIYKLRKKLKLTDGSPVQLRTLYAFGYRLEVQPEEAAEKETVAVSLCL